MFHQYRSDSLNANTYFNKRDGLPKPALLQNQPGFNVGGPIVLPGFDGRNRAFFFVNYEEQRQPSDLPRNRQQFHPDSMHGMFRYSTGGGGVGTVNLFELAARNGQLATPDPIVVEAVRRHPQRHGERRQHARSRPIRFISRDRETFRRQGRTVIRPCGSITRSAAATA